MIYISGGNRFFFGMWQAYSILLTSIRANFLWTNMNIHFCMQDFSFTHFAKFCDGNALNYHAVKSDVHTKSKI